MAASAGGVSCDLVQGTVSGATEGVKSWRREGVNGTAAKKTAQESGVFIFLLTKLDTDANVETWQTSIEALRATQITVVDDDAISHTTCLVMNVSEMTKMDIYDGAKKKAATITISGHKL